MKIKLAMMLIVVLLAGCNLEFLQNIQELNDKYCAETNAEKRKLIIDAIRIKKPDYPDDGLCGAEKKIAEQLA